MESLAADGFFGAVCVEPLAGIVPAEFQRGDGAGVLRRRVFPRRGGVVAAAGHHAGHRRDTHRVLL